MINLEPHGLPHQIFTTLGIAKSLVQITPIIGKGAANTVFRLECGNDRFIARLQNGEGHATEFLKEQWCMERAAQVGVPGAQCVAIGSGSGKTFMIQTAISGVDGADWTGDRAHLWKQLGSYAAKINSIPVTGYGWELRDPTLGDFGGSWKGLLDWELDYVFDGGFFQKTGILSVSQEHAILLRLEEMYQWNFEPRLSHGNLGPKNSIIDDAGTVHVIDWGTAGACRAPHQDLSDILTWEWGADFERAFLDGYGITQEEFVVMRPELDLLVLQRLLDSIRWMAERSPDWRTVDFVVHCRRRLEEMLET